MQYCRNRHDKNPAGSVKLDATCKKTIFFPCVCRRLLLLPLLSDCTRQLESHEKSHPNCFAVGPLIEDGAIRTYYISCSQFGVQTEEIDEIDFDYCSLGEVLAMQEWLTVIDAAIQGVPDQARKRLRTVTNHFSIHGRKGRSATPGDPTGDQNDSMSIRSGRDSLSASLDERGLDLSSTATEDGTDGLDDDMGAHVDAE